MDQELEKQIRTIAHFMGWESDRYENLPLRLHKDSDDGEIDCYLFSPEFAYNSKWDILMPVVKKIKKILQEAEHIFTMAPEEQLFDYQLYKESSLQINHLTIWADIETVYISVISFIEWYNENTIKAVPEKPVKE